MLLRSLSAASQSLASKPMLAELFDGLLDLGRVIEARKIAETFSDEKRKKLGIREL
jgi:hypothetical protein